MEDPVEAWVGLLRQVPSRSAHVLAGRILEGVTREDSAARYCVSVEAYDVLLWRSARDLLAARRGEGPTRPLPYSEEAKLAAALAEALETKGGTECPEAALLEELAVHATVVRSALAAAERADDASPARRREDVVRWLAVAALVALTAYFYFFGRAAS